MLFELYDLRLAYILSKTRDIEKSSLVATMCIGIAPNLE